MISNLAYVHPDAKIGENVTIEPFAYIAANVEIGDGCWIGPSASIHSGARIGKNCKIHSFASIACTPQDLKFKGEKSTAVIGDNCDIEDNLNGNLDGDAKRNKRGKKAALPKCKAHSAFYEQGEQQENGKRPDKAELLTGNGKNKVVLRLGNVAEFQAAVAESETEKAARSDRHHSL